MTTDRRTAATAAIPSFHSLSPHTHRVLRLAALLGDRFTIADLVAVTGAPVGTALAEAQAAGMLTEQDDHLAFRHPLTRQSLYYSMPGTLRSALHRLAARSLAEAGSTDGAVAAQLLAAVPVAPEGWVTEWLTHQDPGAAAARTLDRDDSTIALTTAERRVAALVAQGWSNPDIARELLLSPRTVQTHISHILRKLHGKSRADIARKVAAAPKIGAKGGCCSGGAREWIPSPASRSPGGRRNDWPLAG